MRRRRLQAAAALGLLALLVTGGILISLDRARPLSSLESRLVGSWTSGSPGSVRCPWVFHADRSFATTDGQYAGTWSIENDRLTVAYWQPFRPSISRGLELTARDFVQSRETYEASWPIQFAAEGRSYALLISQGGGKDAAQRWEWAREVESLPLEGD